MIAPRKFAYPSSQDRHAIYGDTGGGKSQAAVFYLSQANIETRPWTIIDYKGDDLIGQIPYAKDIGFQAPTKPGVHILRPRPGQDEEVDSFLWQIYERGNSGVYVDEAFMMPKMPRFKAYPALLVQGRSKHIPMINLTQKPFYVPMHMMSQSGFHTVFHLTDDNDKKRVREFTGFTKDELDAALPEYSSIHYRQKDRAKYHLQPVPDADTILETFARRLAPKRRFL